MTDETNGRRKAVVVGAGPAGLAAAEVLAGAGLAVTVAERMPSPARKLLIAGRGGLNLTHGEPLERFLGRYRPHAPLLDAAVRAFPRATAGSGSVGSARRPWGRGVGIG
jgi:predicted flavoprotein YhiN